MFFTLLEKSVEINTGEHYLLSGLLFVASPLIGLGLPLIWLKFVERERRGAWLRGMLTVGFPALVACVILASLYAPTWSSKLYVKDTQSYPHLDRETSEVGQIVLRTLILGGGTAMLIFAGGFVNNMLVKVDDE
ncbi:MAG: hypothetical protein KDB07_08600 [Planctomycetes bacterium]|nr:hypothetical protein [Planctomycetota bacterium]